MNLEESVSGNDSSLEVSDNIEFIFSELDPVLQDNTDKFETDSFEIEKLEDNGEEKNYDIPKNIFITHKSMSYINSKPQLRICLNSWLKHKNNYKIFFYDDAACDSFIKNNFSEKVYKAYTRLPLSVMKSDLWRYCVIYKYGGIYTDADAECRINPDIFTSPKTLLVCGPESDGVHLCQWCFAAPKNSPIMRSIIDLSVERILNIPKIKGEHVVHYLTGPLCFTEGIEKYLENKSKKTFLNKLQYKKYRSNIMCVFDQQFFNKIIHHHFAGFHIDGWKNERNIKLK